MMLKLVNLTLVNVLLLDAMNYQGLELVESNKYSLPSDQMMSWCVSIQLDTNNSQIMAVCDDKIFVYNYQV